MSDCPLCPVEKACHYPFKPCDCVHQRKFWSAERRADYDRERRCDHSGLTTVNADGFCLVCGANVLELTR